MTITLSRRETLTAGMIAGTALSLSTQGTANAKGRGGKFVANFVTPYPNANSNDNMFRTMRTDAVSFGSTLRPLQSSDGVPQEVLNRVRGKRLYFYTGVLTWGAGQGAGHFYLRANGFWWDVVHCWGNSVVISKNDGIDRNHELLKSAQRTRYRAYIGLPKPQNLAGRAGVGDNTYLDVYESFCEKFVVNYNSRGASGFYHTLEINLSDNKSWWQPSWDVYFAAQKAIRHMSGHGKTSIIAPYLESRSTKAFKTPAQVKKACSYFGNITYGTNLLIAPQDGLGTGTTSFYADKRGGFVAKTEDYFKVMQEALGNRLYVTTECMTPGGGTSSTRGTTSKQRVSQQLWTLSRYTQGSIGFHWNNKTGMKDIPGLGSSWSAGSGNLN